MMTGPLARAARALVQWPRNHVARMTGLDEATLAAFEAGTITLNPDALSRLRRALEEGGAVFLPEEEERGVGVRLKFAARDVRAINRLEGEGGRVGTDDI